MNPIVLKAGNVLIPFTEVVEVRIAEIEHEIVDIIVLGGLKYRATGNDAIEAVMALKPSALEGRGLKWNKNAWVLHNLVGHPGMQLLAWMGFYKSAIRFHDWTTPRPR